MSALIASAQLVLRSQHINEDAITYLVGRFAFPPPTWFRAIEDQTEAYALRAIQWILACRTEGEADQLVIEMMNLAARAGFFSVVQFLHEHSTEEWPSDAVAGAAGRGNLEMVHYLMDHVKAPYTSAALYLAAANGHIHILEYFHDQVPSAGAIWTLEVINGAVKEGQVDVVKWLLEHRLVENPSNALSNAEYHRQTDMIKYLVTTTDAECTSNTLYAAASGGDLSLVRYLCDVRGMNCIDYGRADALNAAAELGHFDVVQFLHKHLPEDFCEPPLEPCSYHGDGCDIICGYGQAQVLDVAAANNHLEVLRFLHERGYGRCSARAMNEAASWGHLEVVKFLHEHRTEGCTSRAMDSAAGCGHLEIIRFLHEHRSEGCTINAMDYAAANHHLEVVKYLHEHRSEGCTTAAMDSAHSDLEMLRFLHENRHEGCTDLLLRRIICKNQLSCLDYVYSHKVTEIPVASIARAAGHGSLDALMYLCETCFVDEIAERPGVVVDAIERAAASGHVHILEYFDTKKSDPNQVYTTKAMDKAAAKGILPSLKYLHFHGDRGCTTDAMDMAAANGHLATVRFLHLYRSEGCTTDAIDQATINDHLDVAKFLIKHRSEGYSYKAIDVAKRKNLEIRALLPDYRVPWKYPGGNPGQVLRRRALLERLKLQESDEVCTLFG